MSFFVKYSRILRNAYCSNVSQFLKKRLLNTDKDKRTDEKKIHKQLKVNLSPFKEFHKISLNSNLLNETIL